MIVLGIVFLSFGYVVVVPICKRSASYAEKRAVLWVTRLPLVSRWLGRPLRVLAQSTGLQIFSIPGRSMSGNLPPLAE